MTPCYWYVRVLLSALPRSLELYRLGTLHSSRGSLRQHTTGTHPANVKKCDANAPFFTELMYIFGPGSVTGMCKCAPRATAPVHTYPTLHQAPTAPGPVRNHRRGVWNGESGTLCPPVLPQPLSSSAQLITNHTACVEDQRVSIPPTCAMRPVILLDPSMRLAAIGLFSTATGGLGCGVTRMMT